MPKQFDYAVFIGRFQPYHLGHRAVIQRAQSLASRKVIVLIGSANQARNIKNPFSYNERLQMIKKDDFLGGLPQIAYAPLEDFKYNDLKWIEQVQSSVQHIIQLDGWTDYPPKVAIIGLDKDSSTQYLKWFPEWTNVDVPQFDAPESLDATSIREILFKGKSNRFASGVLPESSMSALVKLQQEPWFADLVNEYNFVEMYKKQWAAAPYPPTFVTVDAVVFQQGHVLLVKRGANPGKGLWALPGGFVNQNERIEDAVLRELREETGLKVPEPVLRGSIFATHVFDYPDRSLRGRTITHAYGIRLSSTGSLPKVKGGDDAEKAKWVSLCDIKRSELFEDHFDILEWMKGKL